MAGSSPHKTGTRRGMTTPSASQPSRNLLISPSQRPSRFQSSTLLKYSLQLLHPPSDRMNISGIACSITSIHSPALRRALSPWFIKNTRAQGTQPQNKPRLLPGTYTTAMRRNTGNPERTHSKTGKGAAFSLPGKALILLVGMFRTGAFQLGGSSPFRRRSHLQKCFSHGF